MSRDSRPRLVALSIVAAVALGASRAGAQESVAEQLFIEGRALMQSHDYEKACAKFQASHDLDPTGTGTLLNLALCHEQVGKPATAWAEFRQVAAESAGRREDRVTMAREHEAKLRPLLSHITLVIPAASRAAGLRIQLDNGAPIPDAGWETPIPVDPGEHVLEASAPAKVTGTQRFVVEAAGSASQIVVAPLADAPEDRPVVAPADNTWRAAGLTVGGAGLVAIGVGAFFGLSALSKKHDANALCPNDNVCADEPTRRAASDTLASAHTSANVSNVLFGGGLLLVAAGVVLVLRAPSAATPASVRAAPAIVAGGGGLGLAGEW